MNTQEKFLKVLKKARQGSTEAKLISTLIDLWNEAYRAGAGLVVNHKSPESVLKKTVKEIMNLI